MWSDKPKFASFINADFRNGDQIEDGKSAPQEKAKNSWEPQWLHFINFQNLFYFDVNLLNLQMYYFQILHIYMCGVCSPPVLGGLTQIMHRMIWKLHMEQRLQRLPDFDTRSAWEASLTGQATSLAINRGSQA